MHPIRSLCASAVAATLWTGAALAQTPPDAAAPPSLAPVATPAPSAPAPEAAAPPAPAPAAAAPPAAPAPSAPASESAAPPAAAVPPAAPSAPAPEAVAPPAPAPQPIQAVALQAPDLFSAAAGPTDLPADLWRGASADLARQAFAQASLQPLTSAGVALARRLAGAGVRAPDGAGADPDLAAARIAVVLSQGDPAGARSMLDHTPGVALSPALSQDLAEADFVLGQDDQACKVGDALSAGRDLPYWRRLRAFCLTVAGNKEGAQLAFDLADSQTKDLITKRLMAAAASGAPAGDASLRNGLDYVLSRLLKLDLAPAIDSAWAPILIVIAEDPNTTPELRRAAGDRAQTMGLYPLHAQDIAGALAMRLASLTGMQGGDQIDALIDLAASAPAGDKARLQAIAVLCAALGQPLSAKARGELAGFDVGPSALSQARLAQMDLAAAGGARGDAALLALWVLADAGAGGPPPADRARIIRALAQTGFGVDAQNLALEGTNILLTPPAAAPAPAPAPAAPARSRRRRRTS